MLWRFTRFRKAGTQYSDSILLGVITWSCQKRSTLNEEQDQRLPNDAAWAETDAITRPDWGPTPVFFRRAKCAGMGTTSKNPFYAEYRDNQGVARAKAICRGTEFEGDEECPVRYECLRYAVYRPEPNGVWGGVSERERRRIRREIGLILNEEADSSGEDGDLSSDEGVS